MKAKSLFLILTVFLTVTIALTLTHVVYAKQLHIVTTYNYIASITQQITGKNATVTSLASPQFDPHYIVPKPSYIAKLRDADLLIINGAQLEIGWLPPLERQANNPLIQTGKIGFLDLSQFVKKIEVPAAVSRAQGDIHPEGNPHFYLDPYNILLLAQAIYERLCAIAPENKVLYTENFTAFTNRWKQKVAEWDASMKKMHGTKVIEYHKLYDYFLVRYGITLAATIEPLPGIPPTSKHIATLEEIMPDVSLILQDVYHPDDAAGYLSKKYAKPVIVLPHDVGATKDVTDIFTLFDSIVRRITHD